MSSVRAFEIVVTTIGMCFIVFMVAMLVVVIAKQSQCFAVEHLLRLNGEDTAVSLLIAYGICGDLK